MSRPKIKNHKVKIYLTIDEETLKESRASIQNISAYFDKCLKKHVLFIRKQNKNNSNTSPENNISDEELEKIKNSIEI